MVDRHEYDSVVDAMEPNKVDRVQMGCVCIIDGTTTVVVVVVVLTPIKYEQTTQVMVPMHDEMNHIWCCVSSVLNG